MHTPLAMLAALAHAPHGRCDATGRLPGVPAAQASPTADMPALFSPGIIWLPEQSLNSSGFIQGGLNDVTCRMNTPLDGPCDHHITAGCNDSVYDASSPLNVPLDVHLWAHDASHHYHNTVTAASPTAYAPQTDPDFIHCSHINLI